MDCNKKIMCSIEICRICLRNNIKLYSLKKYNLKKYYEELLGQSIVIQDDLPEYFCCECAALLHKFHKFKEKSEYTQNALNAMFHNGPITLKSINNVIAKGKSVLQHGSLEILKVNDRIKTFEEYSLAHNDIKDDSELTESSFKAEEVISFDYYDSYYSDDERKYEDPVNDPVAEETETQKDAPANTETVENSFESEIIEPDLVDSHKVNLKPKTSLESRKRKLNAKKDKISTKDCDQKKKSKRQNEIKSKTNSNVISPKTKKCDFKSKREKLKTLAFLNSGFWKKFCLSEEDALMEFKAKAQDRKYLNAAFKCTHCYRGFSQMDMLDRHIPQRHGESAGPLVCRFCKMRFKSAFFLNKHMRQHFTKYQCLRCNLVCNLENSALFHEEYHNGVIRKCPHCNREFRHLSTFYTHLRTHRSKHMCSLCGESFVSPLGLRLHKKSKHVGETENQETAVEANTYCEICQIKFETKEAFDKHLVHSAMHTDDNKFMFEDDMPTEFIEEGDENDEHDQISEPLVKRKSRVEKSLSAVRKNLPRKPTSKKPTTCHQCGEHFVYHRAFMKHYVAKHPRTPFYPEKERIICEICGASIAPGTVGVHLNQHTRSKVYTCDTCGRSFTTKNILLNHMVTHTGERKHACSLCDKRFTHNGSLSLHYRTFHLKQPYPKRNRRKKMDNPEGAIFYGKEK